MGKGGVTAAQVNQRIYERLTPEEPMVFWRKLVAMATMTIYCGWMSFLLTLFALAFVFVWPRYVLLALWSTMLLPLGPCLWPAFNKHWVFKTWREYFRYSYLFEQVLPADKRYVLVEFPHGAFPIAQITAGTLVQTLFPDAPVYSVAADSVFWIPLWRNIITWIGSKPATKENFKKLLAKGSCAVVVGGIAEMFMQDKRRERIKLLGRKGFARIACEAQVDGVVPVYYFGQSQVLDFGPSFLQGISRKLRVSLGHLHGRFGLPLPRELPIFLVHGHPIQVPKTKKGDPDFEKHVDALHEAVVQELQGLYDRHKVEYGWGDKPLSIE